MHIRARIVLPVLFCFLTLRAADSPAPAAGAETPPEHRRITAVCRAERDNPNYAPGETMRFSITVDFGGEKPERSFRIRWRRSGEDGIVRTGEAEAVPGKPLILETASEKPGFVRIEAWLLDDRGGNVPVTVPGRKKPRLKLFDGGAGVDIFSLKPSSPRPEDFDEFWREQKALLAKVPLRYTMTEVKSLSPGFRTYAVRIDCAGPAPVTGYLMVPENAAPRSLAATADYQGYGTFKQARPAGRPVGQLHFSVNAHGYELLRDEAYYREFFAGIRSRGHAYGMDPEQNRDPRKSYFCGMALRVMRSLQFLRQLPEWNGRDLKVVGISQGGVQAIWGAALVPGVTSAEIYIPWMADWGGARLGHPCSFRPAYVPGLEYFDAVHHAGRIPGACRVEIRRAGLGDYTSPPFGVTVLYNQLRGPKKITFYQNSDHGFVPAEGQKFTFSEKW